MDNPYKSPEAKLDADSKVDSKSRQVGCFAIALWAVGFSYLVGVVSYLRQGSDIGKSFSGGLYFSLEWLAPLLVLSLVTRAIVSRLGGRLPFKAKVVMTAVVLCLVVYGYNATIQYALRMLPN